MRIERIIYSVLILIAAGAAIINWRRVALVAADNEELRLKIESLENEADSSSALAEVAKGQAEKLRTQTAELMRLRNEVTQLRNESKNAENLNSENQRLKAELASAKSTAQNQQSSPTTTPRSDHFPRDSWGFAGYSSPEAALVSAIWSMKEGNPRSYLDSLAPSEQQRMAQVWQNKSEGELAEKHKNDVASISGIRVVNREDVSPGEVVMNVLLEGPNRVERIRMNQVGQDWKFGGFIREQTTP